MTTATRSQDTVFTHRLKLRFVALNLVGGTAVVASYIRWLQAYPSLRDGLWGGVPEGLQPLYVVSMLLAAAGYFPMTWLLLSRVDPERHRVAGRFGFNLFNLFYALILIPSALWLPLTVEMLQLPSAALWLTIRTVLLAVGVGAVGVLIGLLRLQPRPDGRLFPVAVAGSIAFCFQTAVLDALIWPAYFQ